MKIEKINDKQIRCTLTGADLASRKIKLSELAYGTEKAKSLFQDMMQQAHYEFGFESGNSPLMIEAIPVAPDSIVLIITKVDDPDELDTRFSRFSSEGEEASPSQEKHFSGADDILELFQKICESHSSAPSDSAAPEPTAPEKESAADAAPTEADVPPINLIQLFQFASLDGVIEAAHGLNHYYNEKNSLYKDPVTGEYLLVLHQNSCTPESFNKVCNILSEYSHTCTFYSSGEAYLKEHGECLIINNALQTLCEL